MLSYLSYGHPAHTLFKIESWDSKWKYFNPFIAKGKGSYCKTLVHVLLSGDDSEAAEDGLVVPPSADTELKLPSAPTSDNTADSADGSATNDFLSSLQAYTMMSECQTESEERDKKQQLTELSSRLFNQAVSHVLSSSLRMVKEFHVVH